MTTGTLKVLRIGLGDAKIGRSVRLLTSAAEPSAAATAAAATTTAGHHQPPPTAAARSTARRHAAGITAPRCWPPKRLCCCWLRTLRLRQDDAGHDLLADLEVAADQLAERAVGDAELDL